MREKCDLCGSGPFELVSNVKRREGQFRLVKCANCGLVFINPLPGPKELSRMYETNQLANLEFGVSSEEGDKKIFNSRLGLAEKYMRKGKLLDIGCSSGTFMQAAKKRGWVSSGVEINKKSAEFCRKNGFKVFGSVSSAKGSFDMINLGDVIEHVKSPKSFIREVKPLLREGGMLMVSTPNFSSLFVRITQVKPPEHIFYFTKETLSRLLEQCGFEIIAVKKTAVIRSLKTLLTSTSFSAGPLRVILKIMVLARIDWLVEKLVMPLARVNLIILAKKIK